jgi:hypothetical protein
MRSGRMDKHRVDKVEDGLQAPDKYNRPEIDELPVAESSKASAEREAWRNDARRWGADSVSSFSDTDTASRKMRRRYNRYRGVQKRSESPATIPHSPAIVRLPFFYVLSGGGDSSAKVVSHSKRQGRLRGSKHVGPTQKIQAESHENHGMWSAMSPSGTRAVDERQKKFGQLFRTGIRHFRLRKRQMRRRVKPREELLRKMQKRTSPASERNLDKRLKVRRLLKGGHYHDESKNQTNSSGDRTPASDEDHSTARRKSLPRRIPSSAGSSTLSFIISGSSSSYGESPKFRSTYLHERRRRLRNNREKNTIKPHEIRRDGSTTGKYVSASYFSSSFSPSEDESPLDQKISTPSDMFSKGGKTEAGRGEKAPGRKVLCALC